MTGDTHENGSSITDTEKDLKAIWAAVLQKDDLELDRNFIDLGGDSLSAMLCISRVRSAFGVDLAVEDFFLDQATISDIAALIEAEPS